MDNALDVLDLTWPEVYSMIEREKKIFETFNCVIFLQACAHPEQQAFFRGKFLIAECPDSKQLWKNVIQVLSPRPVSDLNPSSEIWVRDFDFFYDSIYLLAEEIEDNNLDWHIRIR